MGAWSHTSFGNDTAADFLYDVEEDVDAIEGAVAAVENVAAGGYIEADLASCILAAAELLAAVHGMPPEDYPDGARAIVARLKSDVTLRARAERGVIRILAASELRELWEESDGFDEWAADVNGLIGRLK